MLMMKQKVAVTEAAKAATCTKSYPAEQSGILPSTLLIILKNSKRIVSECSKMFSSKRSCAWTSAFPELCCPVELNDSCKSACEPIYAEGKGT